MDRDTAAAAVAVVLTLVLAAPNASAQVEPGRTYYRNGLPGVPGSACSQSGCHALNPLNDTMGRIMKAAGTTIPIYGSPDQGMQAIVSLYDDAQLQAISNYLLTLVSPPPPPPPPAPSPPPPPPPPPSPPAPPPSPPPVSTTAAVEYLHTTFGHYFITNIAGEIAALDSGQFAGWIRTGESFTTYAGSNGALSAVCRFFTTAFAPKSSHFYTAYAPECEGLRANGADWAFEAEAFWVHSADLNTGSCPNNTKAVYRLYNQAHGGAPNHRYTTDPGIRADMMAKGWMPEGFGPEGVGFCAPN